MAASQRGIPLSCHRVYPAPLTQGHKIRVISPQIEFLAGTPRERLGILRRTELMEGTGTGAAFESYVNWIGPPTSHAAFFQEAISAANGDKRRAFDALYHSMDVVASFGRTARFDYLTMVGKLGLAAIEPGSTYLQGATGPLHGGRLLFSDNTLTRPVLDARLVELDTFLGVGMQVLEDALCNWQKNPDVFTPFRG